MKMMMFFSCLSKLSTKTNCCDGCWFSTLMDCVKLDAPKILKLLDVPRKNIKFTHLKSHINHKSRAFLLMEDVFLRLIPQQFDKPPVEADWRL